MMYRCQPLPPLRQLLSNHAFRLQHRQLSRHGHLSTGAAVIDSPSCWNKSFTSTWFSTNSSSPEDSSTTTTTTKAKDALKKSTSSTTASLAARDVRLSGRRRFYRQVDVAPVAPPWEQTQRAHKISSALVQSWLTPRVPGQPPATAANVDPTIATTETWYGVTLDGKVVRTPMGQILAVPSPLLAHCLAVEWDQQASHIQPAQMPIMTLVCTALDQVIATPPIFQQHSLNYLNTDTVCFYADPKEDRVLHQRQERAWKPIHAHAQDMFGHSPATVMGADQSIAAIRRRRQQKQEGASAPTTINGHDSSKQPLNGHVNNSNHVVYTGVGLPHPPQLIDQAHTWCHSLDAWHLTMLHSIAAESKSFLVAFYMMHQQQQQMLVDNTNLDASFSSSSSTTRNRTSRRSTRSSSSRNQLESVVQTALEAARVEEEFQIANWGLVEGGHDYDRLNCSIRIRAAQVVLQALALDSTNKF